MKVYLDYVFIENFIVNISVIYQTNIFTKTKTTKLKLLIVSVFLSCISIIKSLDIGNNMLIQIVSISIAIYMLYKPKNLVKYIKLQLYFHMIYITYVGVLISSSVFFSINLNRFYIRIMLYIVTILITYIINKHMWKIWINKIKYNNLIYRMVIKSLNNVTFKVFVDTGNNLKDRIFNYDVIILNSKIYNSKLKKTYIDNKKRETINLDILTATGKSQIKGYIYDDISIRKGGIEKTILTKAIIVFIDEKINNQEYDGLLSYDTYLEKLGGVAL